MSSASLFCHIDYNDMEVHTLTLSVQISRKMSIPFLLTVSRRVFLTKIGVIFITLQQRPH